jgi:hypothetical protein
MSVPLNIDALPTLPAKPAVRYRAVCASAVVGTVLGVLSILTALHWMLAVIPLAGILVSWRALRRIRLAPDEWTGLNIARLGLGLSIGMWMFGYGWLLFAATNEVPWGCQRVTWEHLQPDPRNPVEWIPQSAHDLHEKSVFIKGYMQARRQQQGIKEFVLCPANGDCPFCVPNPRPTQMIRVVLQGDLEAIYTTRLIGVAGKFSVDTDPRGMPTDPSGVPYSLEADYLH